MKNYILEVCVDSVESAIAACNGGANRLELCSDLIIGGTTPSICLFQQVKKYCDIKIHILIRPRFGDFCYTPHEFLRIKEEIKMFKENGADGIVIGILRPDGSLDVERMKELVELGEGMSVTLHRAFDVCQDAFKTLDEAKKLGIHTILTSGQKQSCIEGKALLTELVKKTEGKIDLLVGGGVNAGVIQEFIKDTPITSYHMSGKKIIESQMTYRNQEVNMGLPNLSEYEIWQTDEMRIKEAQNILKMY